MNATTNVTFNGGLLTPNNPTNAIAQVGYNENVSFDFTPTISGDNKIISAVVGVAN